MDIRHSTGVSAQDANSSLGGTSTNQLPLNLVFASFFSSLLFSPAPRPPLNSIPFLVDCFSNFSSFLLPWLSLSKSLYHRVSIFPFWFVLVQIPVRLAFRQSSSRSITSSPHLLSSLASVPILVHSSSPSTQSHSLSGWPPVPRLNP